MHVHGSMYCKASCHVHVLVTFTWLHYIVQRAGTKVQRKLRLHPQARPCQFVEKLGGSDDKRLSTTTQNGNYILCLVITLQTLQNAWIIKA